MYANLFLLRLNICNNFNVLNYRRSLMVSQLRYLTLAYYLWILCLIWLRYCVWSLHDYTNKKKPLTTTTVTPQKKSKKSLVPFFTCALISKNLSFSDFLLTLLPLQMKNCLFFYVYIILACLLIRLYGHSLVNGSIL